MSYKYYIKKYNYYRSWYESLTAKERTGEIGKWIFFNCITYHSLINDFDKAIEDRYFDPMLN